jgi:hypothetical protein
VYFLNIFFEITYIFITLQYIIEHLQYMLVGVPGDRTRTAVSESLIAEI